MPEALTKPHPLVATAAKTLRESEPNPKGFLQAEGERCLDIRVTPGTLERALLIMDTVLKALEARGYGVTLNSEHPWATSALVRNEPIAFFIEERLKQVLHKATPTEELEAKQFSWRPRKYDYVLSGDLRLRVGNAQWLGVTETWADGRKGRLEQYLGEFVRGLEDVADAKKVQRAQQEEARIQREREREQEWQRQQQRYLDERRAAELKEQLRHWRTARELREYVAALRKAKSVKMSPDLGISSLQEWVAWAEAHAERLDPLRTEDARAAEEP